jgi:Protein kinase domain
MSPEQARGKELDARTDLFSFGVVVYEMATGVQPFRGDSIIDIFDNLLHQAPESTVRVNPALPAELEHIVSKALEKDPNLRYQTAADMRTDLQRLKRDTESRIPVARSGLVLPAAVSSVAVPGIAVPDLPTMPPAAQTKSRRYIWIAAVAAVSLCLGIGGWLSSGRARPTCRSAAKLRPMTRTRWRCRLLSPWNRRKSKNRTKRENSGGASPGVATRGGCDEAAWQSHRDFRGYSSAGCMVNRWPVWPRWLGWLRAVSGSPWR